MFPDWVAVLSSRSTLPSSSSSLPVLVLVLVLVAVLVRDTVGRVHAESCTSVPWVCQRCGLGDEDEDEDG